MFGMAAKQFILARAVPEGLIFIVTPGRYQLSAAWQIFGPFLMVVIGK